MVISNISMHDSIFVNNNEPADTDKNNPEGKAHQSVRYIVHNNGKKLV